MASSEMMVGLVIGGAISSSLSTAFAKVGSTIKQLENQSTSLNAKHERLGRILSQSMGRIAVS